MEEEAAGVAVEVVAGWEVEDWAESEGSVEVRTIRGLAEGVVGVVGVEDDLGAEDLEAGG